MELLPSALTSSQWGVKAQAARALGTVSRKLGAAITRETQASIIQLLLAGLEGRTWSGKETLLKALADIASAAPEIMRQNTSDDPDKVVNALLKNPVRSLNCCTVSSSALVCAGLAVRTQPSSS